MSDTGYALVRRLARSLDARLLETHISWVLLTAEFAYKLKKPVRLSFVDYSTLALRRRCCEDEVRLNRPLAPGLYLGVARITGSAEAPGIDGDGAVLEYAVRMKRFPDGALFSERIAAGTLDAASVDALALRIADFHRAATPVQVAGDAARRAPLVRAEAALAGAAALLDPADAATLQRWLPATWNGLQDAWQQRLAQGKVREGHGDLHLANLVAFDGEVAAFDCVEFDAALRTLDVVDDASFTLMDFAARGRPDLGWRLFNAWLERTGEYEGIALLRFWLVGHALVRAQVEHLREPWSPAARRYAGAALGWARPPAAARLFITHGLPGSGKTFASGRLLESEGAVRVRSDVERKRLFGLDALADTRASGVDVYGEDATRRTYDRLLALAAVALRAGFPVVLDAAFLRRPERAAARALAHAMGAAFAIVACEAPPELLRQRLLDRRGDASEADLAVLDRLRVGVEPLDAQERAEAWPPPAGVAASP